MNTLDKLVQRSIGYQGNSMDLYCAYLKKRYSIGRPQIAKICRIGEAQVRNHLKSATKEGLV